MASISHGVFSEGSPWPHPTEVHAPAALAEVVPRLEWGEVRRSRTPAPEGGGGVDVQILGPLLFYRVCVFKEGGLK